MFLFKKVACNDCHVWTVGFWKGILLEEGGLGGLRLDQTMKQTSEVWGLGSVLES